MDNIKFHLPVPVTINHAYSNAGKGRVKTPMTKRWATLAAFHVQKCPSVALLEELRHSNHEVRSSCAAMMGKRLKVSIYHLRKVFQKRYHVSYTFHFPDNQLRDIGNFEKLLTDFLVDHNFLVDDQFIDVLLLTRGAQDSQTPRVEIEIKIIESTD